MKFLCSILILAGVFALNDAFPSSDDQMRLIRDEMILGDLRQLTANRASSSDCSTEYLQKLTAVLETYNTNLKECDTAEQTLIAELNKEATAKIEEINKNITGTCSSACQTDSDPSEGLACIEEESSASSRLLSEISVTAATYAVELTKAIENAEGVKKVCVQLAYNDYSDKSQTVEDEFKKCVNQKEAAQSN
ncbi:uncharacterized protein LOC129951733 [Eupeodes corollae]|uniref:uncharacterized protein LOC129951733 n=1 Tax=Eupeodes corollae TaxID=290404 RepID=UPI002491B879|nr:uncharacterized protein LOC129951733 [Eupeodes corollae]